MRARGALGDFSSKSPKVLPEAHVSLTWKGSDELHTLWNIAERFEKVCRLAVLPFRLVEHIEQKAHLAKQAVLISAVRSSMLQCKISDHRREPEQLKQWICVRVRDMGFQSRILGFVVVPVNLMGQ